MKKIDKLIWKTYEELFAASDPPADFNELVENAKVNIYGLKEIPFTAYEINEEDYNRIVENAIKEGKLTKRMQKSFRITIALGCSPKIKI